ncbi:hypothetical protein CORC01_12722 [Colletotrichum orchidophilum]|uniref:Uncharacterized protein n=1 Tax=Colletotrichum orchidophilum TaxID=1209926 RepID=A0A1G4AS93_9PEZI|nr:uncharacterized protein CORC01_12722 [Colletotrichum orchidophilum]OHE91986.1 hypothetical protein CORC01_12722 [Colletotrichum orchidophilum]
MPLRAPGSELNGRPGSKLVPCRCPLFSSAA